MIIYLIDVINSSNSFSRCRGHWITNRQWFVIKWKNDSCEIEDFVETYRCKLRGILRSRVIRVLCRLIKNVSPYWVGQNLTAMELREFILRTISVAVDTYATLLVDVICMRGDKWWYIPRRIGETIPRNRTQNISGE